MPSQDKLAEFAAWVKQRLTGGEKGEAQLYLERLFSSLRPRRAEGSQGHARNAGHESRRSWPRHRHPGLRMASVACVIARTNLK